MQDAAHHGERYRHDTAGAAACHPYLLPAILGELSRLGAHGPVFDLGCGAGYLANALTLRGYAITGVDPSSSAIALARGAYPSLDLHQASAYDDLAGRFGQFGTVISIEVIEHLYDPRAYARTLRGLLRPGGVALVSTPFHGYWKNLAIALSGATDKHVDPLWDGGHIKFWSPATLTALMVEAGLRVTAIRRVGRIPPLAKSMIAIVERPA